MQQWQGEGQWQCGVGQRGLLVKARQHMLSTLTIAITRGLTLRWWHSMALLVHECTKPKPEDGAARGNKQNPSPSSWVLLLSTVVRTAATALEQRSRTAPAAPGTSPDAWTHPSSSPPCPCPSLLPLQQWSAPPHTPSCQRGRPGPCTPLRWLHPAVPLLLQLLLSQALRSWLWAACCCWGQDWCQRWQ